MRPDQFTVFYLEKRQPLGRIGQDVENTIPAVVYKNDDGFKSVDYTKLVPVLIESIKEQQRLVNEIKLQCKAMEKMVLKQQQELKMLLNKRP